MKPSFPTSPFILGLAIVAIVAVGVYTHFSPLSVGEISSSSTKWISEAGAGYIGPACGSSSCTSSANFCGMTNSGHLDGNGNCDAVAPADSACPAPPANCNSGSPQCLTTNTGNIFPSGTATLSWNCPSNTYTSSQGTNFSTGGALTGSVQVSPSQSTTYTVQCVAPGGVSSGSVPITVVTPVMSIVSSSARVVSGSSVTITWSATGVTAGSCQVTANALPILWTGDSGSQQATITAQTIFTLSCNTAAGSVSQSTTVNLTPSFQEI